jgi:nucleoside-diphosphate-sugar epimerase
MVDAVTGASGYSGRAIAERLLARGRRVITLTGHPDRPNPFGEAVAAHPFDFDNPARLCHTLAGVDTLYNTYWVRFERGHTTHRLAVANTLSLLRAAQEAGVRRIVHVSITNPEARSPLPYFAGKARLEAAVASSGMEYAILRPAVLFGRGDVLVNNIAWFLRHVPVFGIPGDGRYRLQPTHVDDFADLAVELGLAGENAVVDGIGPETYTFDELVRTIRSAVGSRARLLHVSPMLAHGATTVIGRLLGDVILTPDEIRGLRADLLVSDQPSRCPTRLSDWIEKERLSLGRRYASEVARHYAEVAA